MKIVAIICRILLGVAFIVFGANALHPFLPMPTLPAGSLQATFMGLFGPTGWVKVIGAFELVGGLLVLIGGTAPLGLCLLAPIVVNILCYHILLMGGAGIAPGLVVTVLELVLLYAYRANFAGIFTTKATPTA